ncbi:large ribosomal subunit protein uL10m [Topomyia yanbarensis]|uniref:large ribosomal subunit protein uL10m n=1 Tax=Topomyia yanbarensis TaxID=2498891 RepID=UPI00273B7AC2|nr:large ribosomal subunit protein uL10m [Topomyia yanbarensis]
MSSIFQNTLLQSRLPLVCFKRFRGKINIQRPRAPHYERARVLELVKPVYKKIEHSTPCIDEGRSKFSRMVENPYEKIIARDVRNWLDHSRMVAFVHINSIKEEEVFKFQVALHRFQMSYKIYGKSIIQKAVNGTKYETILSLFEARTAFIFCPDETKARQLLSVLKKTPQLILLAGIVEGEFLSKTEFMNFASLPDLTTARAQLAAVLDSAGGKIVSDLECHQKQLVNILESYVRQESSEPEGNVTDSSKP